MAAELKPVYLIHGDDHGAIAQRRAGLKALAEQQEGGSGAETLTGDAATPEGVAAALAAMSLQIGWRVIVVDGVERFKQAEVERHLLPAIAAMPPQTTLALFAREEGRAKAPAALSRAVERAGGQVLAHPTVKPWELPRWVREQAPRLGLTVDQEAARALVAQVGERQQRLLRELEKIALETGGGRVSAETVRERAAHSAQHRAFALADALLAGDLPGAIASYLALDRQGERLAGLTYQLAARLRDAVAASQRLAAGESAAEVRRSLRMPPKAAERFIAAVGRSDPERLQRGLCALGDLEVDLRGGSRVSSARHPQAALSEQTQALRVLHQISG